MDMRKRGGPPIEPWDSAEIGKEKRPCKYCLIQLRTRGWKLSKESWIRHTWPTMSNALEKDRKVAHCAPVTVKITFHIIKETNKLRVTRVSFMEILLCIAGKQAGPRVGGNRQNDNVLAGLTWYACYQCRAVFKKIIFVALFENGYYPRWWPGTESNDREKRSKKHWHGICSGFLGSLTLVPSGPEDDDSFIVSVIFTIPLRKINEKVKLRARDIILANGSECKGTFSVNFSWTATTDSHR